MSITNSTLKHISFGENINWNLLNAQKRLNPENKKKMSRLLSNEEEDISSHYQEDRSIKNIKIKTAATFSSEDNNLERITEFIPRQGPATDRVSVNENPFLRAKASYIEKCRSRVVKKIDPFVDLINITPQPENDVVTFRQLKKQWRLKVKEDILGNSNIL